MIILIAMENLELMPKSYCVKRVWKDHTPTTVRLGNITQISTRLDLESLGLYNGSDLDENIQQLMNSNSDEIWIENNTAASDDQQWTYKNLQKLLVIIHHASKWKIYHLYTYTKPLVSFQKIPSIFRQDQPRFVCYP